MDVSLILCTRDRPALLAEAVGSVVTGERVPAEILIVDQSDAPDPAFERQGPRAGTRIRYLHRPGRGLSRARNIGVREASHPLLAFTDDDVLVTPQWLGSLIDALVRHGPDAVATGRVVPEERPGPGYVPTLKRCDRPAVHRGPLRFDPLTTFNMALSRASLDRVEGFDERLGPGTRYPGGEDNDLAHRLLAAGFPIVAVPGAVVVHRAWRPASGYVPLRWGYGRGQGAFLAKHAAAGDRHALRRLAGTLAHVPLSALRRLVERDPRPGRRLSRPTLALGELAYGAGVAAAAATWMAAGHERSRG